MPRLMRMSVSRRIYLGRNPQSRFHSSVELRALLGIASSIHLLSVTLLWYGLGPLILFRYDRLEHQRHAAHLNVSSTFSNPSAYAYGIVIRRRILGLLWHLLRWNGHYADVDQQLHVQRIWQCLTLADGNTEQARAIAILHIFLFLERQRAWLGQRVRLYLAGQARLCSRSLFRHDI